MRKRERGGGGKWGHGREWTCYVVMVTNFLHNSSSGPTMCVQLGDIMIMAVVHSVPISTTMLWYCVYGSSDSLYPCSSVLGYTCCQSVYWDMHTVI